MPDEAPSRYDIYRSEIIEDILNTVEEYGCQPILFVGSGLSRRYMGAPSWEELLQYLADKCSNIEKNLVYYKQRLGSEIEIGEEFAKLYQDWAWGAGHNEFPEEMFGEGVGPQAYIKHIIATRLDEITPADASGLALNCADEIEALRKIKPHAIITTNYDKMLEILFEDYTPIVGQKILKGNSVYIGEIFKIHGCTSTPESMVFTATDYIEFTKKKKYLSAKLLTFFNEHPLIFIGYQAGDPNIQAILSDIDEALPEKGGVIPNVYILQWNPELTSSSWPARERVISTQEDRNIRVKLIEASDFEWIFDTLAANPALSGVSSKVLRALIARSYELVRKDIPKMTVEANFEMLSSSVEDNESFAKLFGIASISDYSIVSAQFPFSPTELGQKLGGNGWHLANKLIDKVVEDSGVNIKSGDNKYHRIERVNKTDYHKYSQEAVCLLEKVRDGLPYIVDQ